MLPHGSSLRIGPRKLLVVVLSVLLGVLTACSSPSGGGPNGGGPKGSPSGAPLAIAAGSMHSLAVDRDGTVWAWGNNGLGQLGVGLMPGASATPVEVTGLSHVVAVAAGEDHSLALESNGTVWAWGYNNAGQIGPAVPVDPLSPQRTPVQVTGISDAVAIAAGGAESMALLADGTVVAWGLNANGELGRTTFTAGSSTPVAVSGLSHVVAIAAGGTNAGGHALAVLADGSVWAWGKNSSGQLAFDMNYPAHPTPTQVPGIGNAKAVAAGGAFSLALLKDGTVMAWGANSVGQLGTGSMAAAYSVSPVAVANVADVTAVAAGLQHALALRSDKGISAWGGNGQGELGRGTTAGFDADAMDVQSVSDARIVAAGTFHSLAAGAGLWAWGSNLNSQLGGSDVGTSRGTPGKVW